MRDIFQWDVFFSTFPKLMKALPTTLVVGILSMAIGLFIGTTVAIIRDRKIPFLHLILRGYVSFFRGTPLMIQLFLFFFGLPQIWPTLGRLNAFQSSIIIMSINSGAYIAETVRASIGSIDPLQKSAGQAVGFTDWETMIYIILPQAFRVAIPPLGNTFIGVIQGTSLTFMLGLSEIMGKSKMLAAANYRFLETYLAVGLLYWLITLLIGHMNQYLENRLSIGRQS